MGTALHQLEFTARDEVGAAAVALHFHPRRPITYAAGQHALWFIPGGGAGAFTLASAPGEDRVTLATNPGAHSRLKRALGALGNGDRVRMVGPLSRFTLDGAGREVVMLAQGIGITPFRAMLTDVALTGADVAATLVHVGAAAGERAGHPYRADTETAAKEAFYPTGRDAFTAHLDAVTAGQPNATYLVAGTSAFVRATVTGLTARGVDRGRIRRDSFYGWSGSRA